jgi:hypothetical protein
MEGSGCGKGQERGSVIGWLVKFGGRNLMFWGCMLWEGPGYGTKIDGRMDADLYVSILEDELQQSLQHYGKDTKMWSFSKIMTPNTRARRPPIGLMTVDWRLWCGLLNLLILIQLNTFGITSRKGWQSMKCLLGVFRNYGRGFRRSGIKFLLLCVRI